MAFVGKPSRVAMLSGKREEGAVGETAAVEQEETVLEGGIGHQGDSTGRARGRRGPFGR